MAEDDEAERRRYGEAVQQVKVEDNSLGRLLALSDGVFAIAMTLLALNLKAPDISADSTSQQLMHALWGQRGSYWAFLLSFYVIALYWGAHRRLMRTATVPHPSVIRDTVFLLLIVAAMPFPTSMLGKFSGTAFALVLYAIANALATGTLILLTYDVRRCDPARRATGTPDDDIALLAGWLNLGVFLLCIPAAYLFGSNGSYTLLLLLVTNRLVRHSTLAERLGLGRLVQGGSAASGRKRAAPPG